MLESIRGVVIALCCRRFGLAAGEGRGVDSLPDELLAGLRRSLPTGLEPDRLWASFGVLTGLLLDEAELQGVPVSADLARVVTELARDEPAR